MAQTLKGIASLANVSISTASRALSGHPGIRAETIARVRQAADSLDYRAPRSAARLDPRRSLANSDIGIFSLGMDHSLLALPTIVSSLQSAQHDLIEAGAHVHPAHIVDVQDPPPNLLRKKLDGVILMGGLQGGVLDKIPTELLARLRRLPTTWILGVPSGSWGDGVISNDHLTGALAAEYLVRHGHRRLAFLSPKPDHLLFQRREDGFIGAAKRLGAVPQSFCQAPEGGWQVPLQAPQHVSAVQKLVDQVIASTPRPTAIFAASDIVAALVYRALAVRNLKVGRDISVISGNNDEAIIAALHPHLTTFDVHAREMGRLAVRQLATRLLNPADQPRLEIMITPTLLEAESVATLVARKK